MSLMRAAVLAAVAATLTIPAFAAADTWVDRRQANQEQRIDQGIASGALTTTEGARLERGQARIERMESRAQADGVIGPREAAHLEHALNAQSRHIYRQKHDRQQR